MRLHRLLPVLVALAIAGCGSSSSSGGSSGGGKDPASALPAGTLVYVGAAVRPEGEQGDNARALLKKFLPSGTTLESLLDKELADDGQSYAKDIKPWLGELGGIGVLDLAADDPTYIGAVQITDADKAAKALDRKGKAEADYKDHKVFSDDDTWSAVDDDLIVFAETEANMKKGVDAEDGGNLTDSKTFTNAVDDLPDERLGTLFVDLQGAVALLKNEPDFGPQEKAILDKFVGDEKLPPLTAALTAKPDSATIESRFGGSALKRLSSLGLLGGQSTDLVKDAPADAFAIFGAADVGTTLKSSIDTFAGALGGAAITGQLESQTGINLERDVFSWVGDVAVYARGETMADLNGAVIIGVTDKAAVTKAIPRLVAGARKAGAPVSGADVKGADQAFSVAAPGAPGPVVLAQGGDRVVLAFGEAAAAEALNPTGDTIDDSGRYDAATGSIDGIKPSLILSIPTVLALVEASGDVDEDYQEAKPYLQKLDLLVTGTEKDGDALRSLFTVTTK